SDVCSSDLLALASPSGADSAFTLVGSAGGLGLGAWLQRQRPLRRTDELGLITGMGCGGLLGALSPTLGENTFDLDRRSSGGFWAGGAAGGLGGAVLANLTQAEGRDIGLTALGGSHSLATGYGVGLLIEAEGDSQARRIGAVAGASTGLVLGGLWLPRSELSRADGRVIAGGTLIGGLTGALLPSL